MRRLSGWICQEKPRSPDEVSGPSPFALLVTKRADSLSFFLQRVWRCGFYSRAASDRADTVLQPSQTWLWRNHHPPTSQSPWKTRRPQESTRGVAVHSTLHLTSEQHQCGTAGNVVFLCHNGDPASDYFVKWHTHHHI